MTTVRDASLDEALYGKDMFGYAIAPDSGGIMADRFLVPPFSILDAKQGYWQDRKRAWIGLGIESEIGRGESLTYSASTDFMSERIKAAGGGTSIFDPVICELSYKWFTGKGYTVIDPFAGGSVRGIVASAMGRRYWGCELREEQVEANRHQGAILCEGNEPTYVCGDSLKELDYAPEADFVFTCPPYGNLEVYSDDPNDISNMSNDGFDEVYAEIIRKSWDKLKNNRFSAIVVGDYRDKRGMYTNFVSKTIDLFLKAGMEFYNEAILATSIGSLPLRVPRQFSASRKLGKSHQNFLVFVKGDPKKAVKDIGEELEEV